MVAVKEFKNIAAGTAPALTDTAIGVQSGTTDVQYTFAQIQSSIVPPIRTVLTGNLSLFVNGSTGSDSNNGSIGAPWATLQHAVSVIALTIDIAGFLITINVAAGTYVGFGAKAMVGGGNIFIKGAGTASTTIASGPNDGLFNFSECASWYTEGTGTQWWMGGVDFDGTGLTGSAGGNVYVQQYNIVILADPTDLGTPVDISSTAIAGKFHFQNDVFGYFQDGFNAGANITISGNCAGAIQGLAQSQSLISGNYTLSGAQAYSVGFYSGDDASLGILVPTIVSGTATGPQFAFTNGAVGLGIDPTTLPGDTAGSIDGSSSYNGAGGGPTINTQTASYQLVFSDAGNVIEMNAAGANNLTIPANATTPFPINTRIDITQLGAGTTTVVAAGGVTLLSASGKVNIAGQYSGATIYQRAKDVWVLIGELA
jgi:hypothetical protein